MWPTGLLVVYSALIVLASLAGGWLPSRLGLTHARMQVMLSFVSGLMLGLGLWHLLPHAVGELGSIDRAVWWMMIGLLMMFFMIRAFHFHQHEVAELEVEGDDSEHDHAGHAHGAACQHDHSHAHDHGHGHGKHGFTWGGVAVGLALHTLIDGIALGASVTAEAADNPTLAVVGLGTFLAIVLHKPLDAMSITSLMAAGGWSPKSRNLVNFGFSLMCPLGAALFVMSVHHFVTQEQAILGCTLAFSAGVFLCISLGDLLPELQFHSHDRLKLSAALLLGVALAYGIGLVEPEHVHAPAGTPHQHRHGSKAQAAGDEHKHHDEHEHHDHP
jgi:zinc and cadmium transporter